MASLVDQDVGLDGQQSQYDESMFSVTGNAHPSDPRGSLPGCECRSILWPRLSARGLYDCQRSNDGKTLNGKHTSPSLSTSGCAFTKSLMFPFAIHSDTISNRVSVIVTPISGRTFGCRRVFHVTTSLQNLCPRPSQHAYMWNEQK